MRLKVKMTSGIAILILSGKLGYTEMATSLHKKVKSFIRKGISNFIFDLEEVESINSSGLGIIMACQTSITNAKGHLRLIKLRKNVRRFFKITGLDGYFDTCDSEKEAVDRFK